MRGDAIPLVNVPAPSPSPSSRGGAGAEGLLICYSLILYLTVVCARLNLWLWNISFLTVLCIDKSMEQQMNLFVPFSLSPALPAVLSWI